MSEMSDLSRTKCPTENIKNTHLVDESIVHDETKQKTSDHKGQQLGHLAVFVGTHSTLNFRPKKKLCLFPVTDRPCLKPPDPKLFIDSRREEKRKMYF